MTPGKIKGPARHTPSPIRNTKHPKNTPTISSAQRQRMKILRALECGPLTTITAREQLGVMHPGGRVLELRAAGYPIVTTWTGMRDAFGRLHRVGEYRLRRRP